MVHLGPLPGAPDFQDLDAVLARAVRDAGTLQEVGFDAVLVENFGDAPFYASEVPAVSIAGMTRAVTEVARATTIPVGVNVLRNDARGAVAVAAATGAAFIRVNVLAGSMFTDQGVIHGRAAEVARDRRLLAPWVEIYADVLTKHAAAPYGVTPEEAATDLWTRSGAHALIVTGSATGDPADLGLVRAIRKVLPVAPVLVGSGVTSRTVADVLAEADGVIVGTALKEGGVTSAPVSRRLAEEFVQVAARP